jgi:hypothetical protein
MALSLAKPKVILSESSSPFSSFPRKRESTSFSTLSLDEAWRNPGNKNRFMDCGAGAPPPELRCPPNDLFSKAKSMETLNRLFSVAHISPPMVCSNLVLAQKYPLSIKGISGCIELPKPATNESRREGGRLLLEAPESYSKPEQDKEVRWGYAAYLKSHQCGIEHAYIYFDVPRNEQRKQANEIHQGLPEWRNNFVGYVGLLTKHALYEDVVIQNYEQLAAQLFTFSDTGEKIRPHDQTPLNILFVVGNPDVAVTPSILAHASAIASDPMPSEYRLQLAAYDAFGRRNYRQAIVETAAAAEICLTSAIAQKFQQDGVSYGTKLLERFRMLSGRFELARILQLQLPALDFKTLLVEPRNDVMHKGATADNAIAKKAIDSCDQLLCSLTPIPPPRTGQIDKNTPCT